MEIKQALDLIDKCDDSYYNEGKSLISDQEYDGLKDYIKASLEDISDNKLKKRIKETLNRVGAATNSPWNKISHEVSMSSLNKVNTPEEFFSWWNSCGQGAILLTHKLDGISISLKYVDGNLVSAATRGDGSIGEDITRNVLKMKGVVKTLSKNFTGHIRGEIILLHSDWKNNFPDLANPRNGASGISKRLDGQGCEHLSIIFYTIEGKDFDTEDKCFKYIEELGLSTPKYYVLSTAKEVNDLWREYIESLRSKLNYDIDGLVIRINNKAQQVSLGEINSRPKGAIAFKFESPIAKTILRDVINQTGDTGVVTPVAVFDKVSLLGAWVERASLHNWGLISSLKLSKGCSIYVERANDVIPKVKYSEDFDVNNEFKPPKECPECSSELIFDKAYLVCQNTNGCPAQIIGRFNKWISELGIMEWGTKVLDKLIKTGSIKDVYDLYTLSVDDLSSLDRMGDKSAKNLISELDKFREVSLENFFGGLGINGIATTTVKQIISSGYDSFEKIMNINKEDLLMIPGFGEIRAEQFVKGIEDNLLRIEKLYKVVKIKEKYIGALTGKSFCFTGSMNCPRKVLEGLVKDNGGEVKNSVGKGLSYLVIADPNSTSSKAQGAKKLGVSLISEEEFLKMAKTNV